MAIECAKPMNLCSGHNMNIIVATGESFYDHARIASILFPDWLLCRKLGRTQKKIPTLGEGFTPTSIHIHWIFFQSLNHLATLLSNNEQMAIFCS